MANVETATAARAPRVKKELEYLCTKGGSLEHRTMYQSFKLNEAIRQIKNGVDESGLEIESGAILSAYKWSYRLSQVCAARLLKPQRLLTLTLDEEKKRVFEYWKDWEMRFGHLSWLEKQEADAVTFRRNIKKTVLKWSDQIPFWVKVKGGKQLYGTWQP